MARHLAREEMCPYLLPKKYVPGGKYGKNLFKLAFAKELAKARLGKFDTSSGQPVFTLTKAEFIEWYETHLEEQGKTLVSFLNEKLSGGNKDVAKGK